MEEDKSIYTKLSAVPKYKLDTTTGELSMIGGGLWTQNYPTQAESIVNHQKLTFARTMAGDLGEKCIKNLFKQHISSEINDTKFDGMFIGKNPYEVKTSLVGNCCAITDEQLEKMPNDGYYFLVFYKMAGFKNISNAISNAEQSSKDIRKFIDKHFVVKTIFLLPKKEIIFLYNVSNRVQRKIREKHNKIREYEYARVTESRCMDLVKQNLGNYEQYQTTYYYNGQTTIIYSHGLNILQL